MSTNSTISKRENQVLNLIAYEHSSKEISQKLCISCTTVHSHRKNLHRKLKAGNVAGLVRKGMELGLIKNAYREAI